MCLTTTGAHAGWAIGVADCAGDVTLEYFDEDGVSQGATLPANWKPCVQGVDGPEWAPDFDTLTYAAILNVDFDTSGYITTSINGPLTLTGSNYAPGREKAMRIVETGGASRSLAFPAAWVFVGSAAPTTLLANRTGLLRLISYTSAADGVVAQWEVQPT